MSKIRRKTDGRIFVWKELNYGQMREKEKQLVVSEVNILRELRHPFIVRYYDRIIDKAATKIYIVMEYCEGGDLGSTVKRCKKENVSVDEEFVWKVCGQIVAALKDCHRHKDAVTGKPKPILHRDLKPGNIFMDAAQNIKIGDFGLAKELPSESALAYTNVGTPFYMSPEMINECRYNEKSDIWALGCLLYELCALAPPFDATNHLSLAVKINAGKFSRIPSQYSEDLYRAVRWMLSLDQSKRPSVEDLEKIPQVKAVLKDTCGPMVKEYQLTQQYAGKARDLKAKEEELQRREAAVADKERILAEREKGVAQKEAAISAKMAELQRRETAMSQMSQMSGAPRSRAPTPGNENDPSMAGGMMAMGRAPVMSMPALVRSNSDLPAHLHSMNLSPPAPGMGNNGMAAAGAAAGDYQGFLLRRMRSAGNLVAPSVDSASPTGGAAAMDTDMTGGEASPSVAPNVMPSGYALRPLSMNVNMPQQQMGQMGACNPAPVMVMMQDNGAGLPRPMSFRMHPSVGGN